MIILDCVKSVYSHYTLSFRALTIDMTIITSVFLIKSNEECSSLTLFAGLKVDGTTWLLV